jgi:hypothetical protein
LHAIGILKLKQNECEKARLHLVEALEVAKNLGDVYRVSVIRSDLARIGADDLSRIQT